MSWVTNTTVELRALPDREQEVLHRPAGLRVERAERLVEQQDVGLGCEGARDRDPLAHPARELVGRVVGELRQTRRCRAAPRPARPAATCASARTRARTRRSPPPCATGRGCRSGTPCRGRGPGPTIGSWSISTVPTVGISSPAMMLSSVDFPQPDDPTRHTNSRSATSRFTWSMASTVWRLVRNSFTRSVTTSLGGRSPSTGAAAARTVTTVPTAPPGCATNGARGR